METKPQHSIELGDILGKAFELCRQNLLWLLIVVVIGFAAGFLSSVIATNTVNSIDRVIESYSGQQSILRGANSEADILKAANALRGIGGDNFAQLGRIAGTSALYSIIIGTVTVIVTLMGLVIFNRSYIDGEAKLGQALRASINRLLPAIGTAILFFLIVIPSLVVLIGIYLAVAWIFFFIIVLNEKKGGFNSFEASRQLVEGRWWKTLLYLLVPAIIIAVINYSLIEVIGGERAVAVSHILTAITVAVPTVLSQYQSAFITVMYYGWKHNPVKRSE